MIFIIVVPIVFFIVFFIAVLLLKPRCPECGCPMFDIDVCDGHIVYKCSRCGKEWI